METIKLSSRGQIVIPKEVRDLAHLSEGAELTVVFEAGEIKLRPVPAVPVTTHDEVAGCLHRPGHRAMSQEETDRAIAALLKSQDDATRS